jgi:hypothetical protein
MSLNGLSKSVNNTASNIVNRISNNLPKNLPKNTSNTGSFMMAPLPAMTTAFNNTTRNVKNAASNVVSNVALNVKNAASNVKNAASNAVETMNEAAVNLANNVKNTMNNNGFSAVTEPIVESINGSMNNDTSPFFTIPVMIILGVLIVALILFIVFRDQIAFGLSVAWQKTKNFFAGSSDSPPPTAPVAPVPAPSNAPKEPVIDRGALSKMLPGKKEVFNIATDKYTYTDAEPLCKAFGAELATYDQVKDAWNNGADWCNYGWVKGQSAVFPTQETTYNKLQAGPEDQRMACGVPGVNGGYFDNPELRFGVNCYGSKPSESETDTRFAMGDKYLTAGALAYDKKVQDYKANKDEIPVNPFKTGAWSS